MLGVYLLVCSNLRNTQINETYSNICMQQSNKKSWKLRATPKSLMRTRCWICPSNTEQDVLSPVKGCFEFDSFWQSFLTWATLTWVIQSTRNLTIIHSLPSFSNQNHKFAAYFALKYHSHSIKKNIDLTGTHKFYFHVSVSSKDTQCRDCSGKLKSCLWLKQQVVLQPW